MVISSCPNQNFVQQPEFTDFFTFKNKLFRQVGIKHQCQAFWITLICFKCTILSYMSEFSDSPSYEFHAV